MAIKDGGPAFPVDDLYEGMSLLDWFAGQALAGLLAADRDTTIGHDAGLSYELAQAMLTERERITKGGNT